MRLLVLLALLAVGFAGCAGSPGAPASSPSPTLSPDMGAIRGRVLDEELKAVPGAEVGLVRTAHTAETDEAGGFRFHGLEPGTYQLAAQRIGYTAASRSVEVRAGEVTDVTLTVQSFAILTPYNETKVFDGYIQAGGLLLDLLLDDTTGLPAGCVKCLLRFNVTDKVHEVLFELSFRANVNNPGGENLLEWQLWSLDGDGDVETNYGLDTWQDRARISFNRKTALPGSDAGAMPEKAGRYELTNYCDALFVCQDQRFKVFYTTFYLAPAPDNFTALPQP